VEALFGIAFITGLMSSFHCLGMCGPLVLALPTGGLSPQKVYVAKVLYNLGRLLTYGLFGLLMGLIGTQIAWFGMQQKLSVLVGLLLLFSIFSKKLRFNALHSKINGFIGKQFRKVIGSKKAINFLIIGMVNGLLPCGMVYMALGAAVLQPSVTQSFVFMLLFGLGTVPMLFFISILPNFLSFNTRQNFSKIVPIYTFVLAGLFIIRGLGLGIPYLSPAIAEGNTNTEIVECHTPSSIK
jgi:uncharacterized protein